MKKPAIIIGVVFVFAISVMVWNRDTASLNAPRAATGHGGGLANLAQSTSGDAAGRLAPDFAFEGLNGETITLSSYRGEKPVVLDFWASWCPNCRRDMPVLNRLYEKYGDQIEVIGINLQENTGTVRRYIDSVGIDFPIALDPRGSASHGYGIRYTNTHVMIDKEGNLVKVIPGDIREADIVELIELSA